MNRHNSSGGFSMLELFVTISLLAALGSLLIVAVSSANTRAKRTACVQQIRQVTLSVLIYSTETGTFFSKASGIDHEFKQYIDGKQESLGGESRQRTVYRCPLDKFWRDGGGATPHARWSEYPFTSYFFNGLNAQSSSPPGIAGLRTEAVQHPVRTVVIREHPALFGASWHDRVGAITHPDALNALGFVDGHVAEAPIYWNGRQFPSEYDPGPSCVYQWSER